MNLPERFKEKMQVLLHDEYEDYIRSYEKPYEGALRVNTNKISVEEFLAICPFPLKQIPWIENGFYFEKEESPAKHPYYFAGLYYLQEPSAMTPANRLPVAYKDKILDLCAAPGGKATELGVKLGGEGVLIANDISNSRAKGLLKNIEMFGIGNALVVSESSKKLVSYFPEYFDKILIDAPCSGEGMFRREPSMMKNWEENGPQYYSCIQKEIVEQALTMLKPGGMMLYSTCTFSTEENEDIVKYLLGLDKSLHVVPIESFRGFSNGFASPEDKYNLKECVRIFPHKMNGEGHFLAFIKKEDNIGTSLLESPESNTIIPISKNSKKQKKTKNQSIKKEKVPEEVTEFLHLIQKEISRERIWIKAEQVYCLPEGFNPIRGLRFLRTGLYLGDMKKNKFEPSQALAMSLKKEEYSYSINLPLQDKRVIKYLKGETIELDGLEFEMKGIWQLVCVDGYPLGWGKMVNGALRNKYYSGWRWLS